MGQANDRERRRCYLTQREQVLMGHLILNNIQAKNGSERQAKIRAIRALNLMWVVEIHDQEVKRTPEEVERVFDAAIKAGRTTADAVLEASRVMGVNRFDGKLADDKFELLELERDVLAYLVEKLDGMAAGGIDDIRIGDIEDRFREAKTRHVDPPGHEQTGVDNGSTGDAPVVPIKGRGSRRRAPA